MVGPGGLEPPTPALSTRCSNQLSYEPKFLKIRLVEPIGFEPTTSWMQIRRSSNWATAPVLKCDQSIQCMNRIEAKNKLKFLKNYFV